VSNPAPVKNPYPRSGGQIHGGVLGRRDGSSLTDPAFLLGFRGGSQITPVLQLGLGVDWRHKSGTATEVLQTSTGPGGEQIVLHHDFNHYSSDLVPAMVYLQFSIPIGFVPYVGAGAGWEVLFLSAEDYQTGSAVNATYNGFGWQAWGGVGVPLGNRMKMFGEAFFNDADLNRNVYDYNVDASYRETIHEAGVGIRGGLSYGF
jgi:opacity protein-like surface antigen